MRYVFLAALTAVSLCGQNAGSQLSITNYQVVTQEPAGPGSWKVTYRADLVNLGEDLSALKATVSTVDSASVQTVSGQDVLTFANAAAGAQVTSANTFTVLVSRTHRFRTASLHWTFEPADTARRDATGLPVSNAGRGQTVKVGNLVTLSGARSTTPAGAGRLTYNWTFHSRPAGSSAALSDAGSVMPTFVADVAGDYELGLTVTNGLASSRSTVTISTTNSAPVADAGRNWTLAQGSTVHLNGAASTDVDGDSLSYSWTLVRKPAESNATLTGANTVTPSFVIDQPGDYTAQLVTNDGHVDSAPSTVTFSTRHTPPVANAGIDQVVQPSSPVQLDGAGSTDVDGHLITYSWTLISAPNGSTVSLINPTAVRPMFIADVAGIYVAQLMVSDSDSSAAPSTVVISTGEVRTPEANAGRSQATKDNATVQLRGSGRHPRGLPLSDRWALIGVPAGSQAALSSQVAPDPTFQIDQPGTYVAQLTVSDGSKDSTPSTVLVSTTTTPPPVASAGPNQSVTAGTTVTLNGSGSTDSTNTPLTYSWTFNSKPNGSAATLTNANTASPSFVPDEAGAYVVQLIVNDGTNNSNPVTVTVTATLSTAALTLTPSPLNLAPDSQGTLVVSLPAAATGGDVVVNLLNSSGCFPGSCVAELPPGSTVTIRQGFFATTIPVRGEDIGTSTITAVAAGYVPASAVVNVVAPTLTLTLASPAVGFGSTDTGTITLSAPAGVEGVQVNLTATSGISVPATVIIPIGSSTGTFTITGGNSPATATITAVASGYPTAMINVQVGSRGQIVLQSGLTVGTGQSVPIALSLATFTGTDVTVNLASSDPTKVTVSPASITIPAGHNAPLTQPTVTGVDFGSANITATATGFIGTSTAVTVTGALSFTKSNVAVGTGGTQNLTLNLSSPAPAEGVVVNLSSSNPSAVTVPATVTILPGTLSATVPATGVAPGFSNIIASTTALNVSGANATVNVVTAGTIILPANVIVGPGQTVAFPVTISPAAPSGGVTITLASSNSNTATISPATITINAGQTTSTTVPQLTGVNFGTATISATANGYTGGSQNITVGATFALTPQNSTIALPGSENLTLTLSSATPSNLVVTLTSSGPGVASVPTSVMIPGGALTVAVPVTAVALGGPVTITASAPGVASGSASVLVSNGSSGVINFPSSLIVAAGSSVQVPVSLSAAAPQPGVTINLSSNNPAAATVSPSAIFVGPGQTSSGVQVTINGVAPGAAVITAQATGFGSATMAVTVQPPSTISLSPPTATLTAGAVQNLTLGLSTAAPASGLTVTLVSSNPSAVTVPSTFQVAGNATSALIPITGVSAGTATIMATAPGVTGTGTSTITVVFGTISIACPTVAPGQTLGCTVTLSAIPRGAVTVALTSDNPAVITAAATAVISSGTTSTSQALITGVSFGTANVMAAASGWTPGTTQASVGASVSFTPATLSMRQGTTQSLTLRLSGPAPTGGVTVNLSSDNTNVATVPATATFATNATTTLVPVTGVGLGQATIHASNLPSIGDSTAVVTVSTLPDIILPTGITVSPGLSTPFPVMLKNPAPQSLFVVLTSSNPSVVTINHGQTSANVFFLQGQTTPVSVPVVDGVTFGSATITGADAGLEGLSGDTETVVVAGSAAFFPAALMLQPGGSPQRVALTLTPAAPAGGLTLSLSSDNPAVATVPATVTFPAGLTSISVPITPVGSGSTTIHANDAPGIPDTTLSVTVGGAGLTLPSNVTAAPGQSVPFPIMISPVAPSGGVTVSLSTSNSTIATITPSVFIQQGQVSPATQPTLTGVNFGTTTVTGSAPGYGSATQSVNVGSAFAFSPPTGSVAAGATANLNLTLSVPAPAGLTVNLNSSNTAAATVPASLPFAAGATSISVPVTGVNTGQAVITASTNSPNVASANATVTVGTCAANCTTGTLTITTTSLPTVTQNQAYTATLTATGGTAPYFWNASALPNGLSIVGNQITGMTSLAPSSRNVIISVSDSASPSATMTAHLVLTVVPPGSTQPLAVATTSLPSGNVGNAYSAPLSATGGTGTITFSATGLPQGLMVVGTQITGTPTATCTPCMVTITVKDSASPQNTASATIPLTINPPQLQITTTSLPGGTINQQYSSGSLTATGGTPPYTWSASGLPNGLGVSGNQITGTPTAPFSGNVTITVKDSASPQNTASTVLMLNITGQLTINTSSLPHGTQFASYTAQLSASGGTGGLTFTAQGLPAGLNVSGSQIVGTPQVAFNSNVTITVSDSASPPNTISKALSLVINPQLALTTSSLPTGTINTQYAATLAATGGTGTYTFSATPLPAGLMVVGNQITGVPTVGFNSAVTITVTDTSTPANTASKALTLVINSPLSITTTSLSSGTVGQAYSTPLAAVGGTSPYTFSATGLPNGLMVSGSQITGTPTVAFNGNVTITVMDSSNPQGTATKPLSLTISLPALSVTTTSLNSGTVGTAYSTPLAGTGGLAPYTFSATGLPQGLGVNGSSITGTPTAGCSPNPCSVTITIKDSASPQNSATKVLSLNVPPSGGSGGPLTITGPLSLPNGTVGTAYSVTLTATGGTMPYTWQANGLPNGLTISGSQIVGTPTAAINNQNVILQVSDSANNSAHVNETITITAQSGGGGNCTPITINTTSVGQNLQTLTTVTLGVPPAVPLPATGAFLDFASTDPTKALLSLRQTQAGSSILSPGCSSVTAPNCSAAFIPTGSGSTQIFVQGLAQGVTTITARLDDSTILPIDTTGGVNPPPPYCTSNTGTVNVTPSGFVLAGPNGIGKSFVSFAGAATPLSASAAQLDSNNNFVQIQQLSATAPATTVNFASTNPSAGSFAPSSVVFTAGIDTLTTTVLPCSTMGSTCFTAGNVTVDTPATLSATPPAGFSTPANGANSVGVDVEPPGVVNLPSLAIGNGLEVGTVVTLNGVAPTSSNCLDLDPSDPTHTTFVKGLVVAVTSNTPDLLFSRTATGMGSSTVNLCIPAGRSASGPLFLQALSNSGSATYTASVASGFGTVTGSVTFGQSGVAISAPPTGPGVGFTTTEGQPTSLILSTGLLDGSGNFVVEQSVAGGTSVTTNVTSSNTGVGTVSPSSVTITSGTSEAGTVFTASAGGSSTVSASVPSGFSTAKAGSLTATVQLPSFSILNNVPVGQNLQVQGKVVLGLAAPAQGLNITFTSNNPNLLISGTATGKGSQTLLLTTAGGATSLTYYLQSTAASGTAAYTVSANGYQSRTASNITLAPAGFVIVGPNGLSGGNTNAVIQKNTSVELTVSAAALDSNNAASATEQLAGGQAPVTVMATINGVGSLDMNPIVIQPGTNGTVTNFSSPVPGTATVSVSTPSGYTTPVGVTGQPLPNAIPAGPDPTKVNLVVTN